MILSLNIMKKTNVSFIFQVADPHPDRFSVPPRVTPARILLIGATGSAKGYVREELSKCFNMQGASLTAGE